MVYYTRKLVVYFDSKKSKMMFRDSNKLLSASLATLGEILCPELGRKGDVDHTSVNINNLATRKNCLNEYMMQDIYLLRGVIAKAQDICSSAFFLLLVSLAFSCDYVNSIIGKNL
jgi:hypothetical protein